MIHSLRSIFTSDDASILDKLMSFGVDGRMSDRLTIAEVEAMIERLRRASKTGQSVGIYTVMGVLDALLDELKQQPGVQHEVAKASVVGKARETTEQTTPRTTSRVFYGMSLPDAAYKQLQIVDGPQSPTEVWDGLRNAGFETAHKDPVHATMNALMKRARRHGDVLLVGKGKWDLKSRYSEAELAALEENLGGMAGRDHAAHREQTKIGMQRARARGVRLGAEQKIDLERAAELFREGKTPKDVREFFNLRSISTVYRYFKKDRVRELQEEGRQSRSSGGDQAPQKPSLRVV